MQYLIIKWMRGLVILPLLWGSGWASEADVQRLPLSFGLQYEFGAIMQGTYQDAIGEKFTSLENEWVDHYGAYFIQSILINQRSTLSAGMAGAFQNRKPEVQGAQFESSARGTPFLGPIAVFQHKFGNPEAPLFAVEFGSLVYKYNSGSKVLGEYLFRSTPYPTLLRTGGYNVVNNSKAYLRGAKAAFRWEGLSADLLVTTETSLAPLFDFSLGGVVGYSLWDGFLEFKAGLLLKNLIPINEDKTTPKDPNEGYFTYMGKSYTTNSQYYDAPKFYYQDQLFEVASVIAGDLATPFNTDSIPDVLPPEVVNALVAQNIDPNYVLALDQKRDDLVRDLEVVNNYKAEQASPTVVDPALRVALKHYSFGGTVLMGLLSLDLQKLLPLSFLGEQDLKMYVEADLVGVKDYPVYFESKKERLPLIFGINLPAFGLLDVLSFEMEYFNSPHLNNSYNIGKSNSVLPYQPSDGSDVLTGADYNDATRKDNTKWALFAEKKLFSRLTLRAQGGRTHLQLTGTAYFFGPQFATQEITTFPGDWYWLAQLEWGI